MPPCRRVLPAGKVSLLWHARTHACLQVEVALTFESAFWNSAASAASDGNASSSAALPPGTLLGACTGSEAGSRGMFNVCVVGAEPNTLVALASGEAAEKVGGFTHV